MGERLPLLPVLLLISANCCARMGGSNSSTQDRGYGFIAPDGEALTELLKSGGLEIEKGETHFTQRGMALIPATI